MSPADFIPKLITLPEKVDINQYPTQFIDLQKDLPVEVALGDLHGHTLKLVFFLLTIKAISMTEENYLSLVKIYNDLYEILPHLPSKDLPSWTNHPNTPNTATISSEAPRLLSEFQRLVGTITVINTNNKLDISTILMGDTVCDRGCLDWLTFRIDEKKFILNFKLLSNHDMDFIALIEQKKPFNKHGMSSPQGRSAGSLQLLIDANVLTRDEIETLYKEYRKNYVAIHYNIDSEGKLKAIYTHAPMNMAEITKMATGLRCYSNMPKYQTLFPDPLKNNLLAACTAYDTASRNSPPQVTSAHIIALIEVINDLAKHHLENETFHQLAALGFDEEAYTALDKYDKNEIKHGNKGDTTIYPYHMLGWRRQAPAPDIQLADLSTGEFPTYVNGHDPEALNEKAIVLDNKLCKSHTQHTYSGMGPQGELTVTVCPCLTPDAKKALVSKMVEPIFQTPAEVAQAIKPTSQRGTFTCLYKAGPATAATGMMLCAIAGFVVASVIKNEMLGFMGMKSFEHNLILSLAITAVATMGTYVVTPTRPKHH